jgi:hypothetical protein
MRHERVLNTKLLGMSLALWMICLDLRALWSLACRIHDSEICNDLQRFVHFDDTKIAFWSKQQRITAEKIQQEQIE